MKLVKQNQHFDQVKKVFKKSFPNTSLKFDLEASKNLFSHFELHLDSLYLKKIEAFCKTLYPILHTQRSKALQESYSSCDKQFLPPKSLPPFSVISCLDFHIHPETKEIKLIEANTNASGFLVGQLTYEAHGYSFEKEKVSLKSMFKKNNFLHPGQNFIIDKKPEEQKMYLEFLLYKEFFESFNIKTQIMDSHTLDSKILSLDYEKISIYNRDTDFYLTELKNLKELFIDQKIHLSPHPLDYEVLAHKDNLERWIQLTKEHAPGIDLELLRSFLLPSQHIQKQFNTMDEAWAGRKKLFLKPADSFGGKATYKGSSISKKYFAHVWENNFLAQSYFPAAEVADEDGDFWKFDLRFYFFEDQLIYPLARIYKGQTTNFSSPGGGFSPVVFDYKLS